MSRWAAIVVFAAVTAACSRRPTDAELDKLRDEVEQEEQTARKTSTASEQATWTLSVRGNVESVDYDWPHIVTMATSHIKTTLPSYTQDLTKVLDFRGVLVRDLLTSLGAKETDGPGGKDVTLVAADGYYSAQPLRDSMRWPILLAIEMDGVPLKKTTGGPILQVYPHTSHPESKLVLGEGGVFYVTTIIVGTEAVAISVGDKTLHAKELDALPERAVEGPHSFRFRWPASAVRIEGPRLRDVIKAGGIDLAPTDRVLVRRKPKTETAAREVTTLEGKDVLDCDILLGLRWGTNRALIPAGQGGPAVLAFPPSCPDATHGQVWPTFVEKIEVVK